MRRLPATGLLLILTGCMADDAAQKASEKAATDAYAECTMTAVRRLDDGRSDPASIAMGVAGACNGFYQAMTIQMQQKATTEVGQRYVRDEARANELRLATAAVLTYRASKKQQQ